MLLRIRSITYLAARINGYEFVDPGGDDLPRFAAGAHISVRLSEGLVRDFSLWNDPAECGHYCIAVLREGPGSSQLHDRARVGDLVEGSPPRNNFPLAVEAERDVVLVEGEAGCRRRRGPGIGRTSCRDDSLAQPGGN